MQVREFAENQRSFDAFSLISSTTVPATIDCSCVARCLKLPARSSVRCGGRSAPPVLSIVRGAGSMRAKALGAPAGDVQSCECVLY